MAPSRKRKARFSTNTSLDLLNNVSSTTPANRRHTARHDSVYDIPISPERRKPSRKSEPPLLKRPRTRQNKSTPTPEPADTLEPNREPESVEEAEAEQPSSDADDYQDAELNLFSADEEGEEKDSRADDPRPEGTGELFEHWEDNGDEGQENEAEREMEAEGITENTDTMPRQDNAEDTAYSDQNEEGPNDDYSIQSQGSRQLMPLRNNVEIVIDNSPSARSYLSHGFAETIHDETIHDETIHDETIHDETIHDETIHDETIHDADYQDFESQKQLAKRVSDNRKKETDPNIQLIRDLRHWFGREIGKTSVGPGWNKLNEKGRGLKAYAISPRPKYLEFLYQLFAEYRTLYKEAIEHGGVTERLGKQLQNIKESIVTEVRQLFEHASEMLQESSVLDQFEAHFIPKMVILTQLGFRVYRMTDGRAHDQLRHALDLMSVCIGLIKQYMGLLSPIYRSFSLAQPLQRVIKALENGQLRDHSPVETNDQHHWADIPPVTHRWTVNEERVLRYGMVKYVDDENPFLQIATHWGHKLPGRSMRDMEGKAREMGLL